MKKLRLSCLLTFLMAAQLNLPAQVSDASRLVKILQKSETDSIAKIERSAALKFHQLINDYRLESGEGQLIWDDTRVCVLTHARYRN